MAHTELKQILVVEDEADIGKIIQVSLINVGGFGVDICSSAHEALKVLQQSQPDLIILDVMMPVMDGPSFLKEIRQSSTLQDLPVVFMTAKVQPHEVEEYLAMGVLGVISKPFDPVSLPDQIRKLWQSSQIA